MFQHLLKRAMAQEPNGDSAPNPGGSQNANSGSSNSRRRRNKKKNDDSIRSSGFTGSTDSIQDHVYDVGPKSKDQFSTTTKEIAGFIARTVSNGGEFLNALDPDVLSFIPIDEPPEPTGKTLKDPEKYGGVMWKDDPIEKSRRVWEWWKANHSAPSIHYFAITARLVALVQSSSASVERVLEFVKRHVRDEGSMTSPECACAKVWVRKVCSPGCSARLFRARRNHAHVAPNMLKNVYSLLIVESGLLKKIGLALLAI